MAVLTMLSDGLWLAVTVSVSVGEVVPSAVAEATLVTKPAFRSAWGMVWLAVQVICSPGSSSLFKSPTVFTAGHDSSVAMSSAIVTGPVNDTLPLLVTR